MLKTCLCVLTNAETLPDIKGDVVGVDKGAWICHQQGISMTAALGDFDSITETEKSLLMKACDSVIVLNQRKDVSDSEAAVLWARENGYERIVLVTSMSGRFDHSYVNFRLVEQYGCELWDSQNHVFLIEEGSTTVQKQGYKYISFFAVDQAIVTLSGFSYELDQHQLNSHAVLCLSNEIVSDFATVTTTGKLWCIQSKDKN